MDQINTKHLQTVQMGCLYLQMGEIIFSKCTHKYIDKLGFMSTMWLLSINVNPLTAQMVVKSSDWTWYWHISTYKSFKRRIVTSFIYNRNDISPTFKIFNSYQYQISNKKLRYTFYVWVILKIIYKCKKREKLFSRHCIFFTSYTQSS